MTDATLKEKIVECIDLMFKKQNCGYGQESMDACVYQILALFDEAGYLSHKEIQDYIAHLGDAER